MKRSMKFKIAVTAVLAASGLWAAMPQATPSPTAIPSLLKPNSVPKNLRDYDSRPIMVLMEVEKQREVYASRVDATPVKLEQLLPSRVYLYYLPKEQRWHLVLTDSYGKLKMNPMEFLRASSIVPGSSLGAKNPTQNYILGHDKIWLPTFKKERYEFWVNSTPPLAKYVEFEPMPAPEKPKGGK